MDKIRVIIADDHRILREGIRALLGDCEDIEVVGEAADGRAALELCDQLDPDVVLMDINMPGLGGLEATLELRRVHPRIRVLVLTQYDDREYVRRFLKAGVSGFVLKRTAGSALADAIRDRAAEHGEQPADEELGRQDRRGEDRRLVQLLLDVDRKQRPNRGGGHPDEKEDAQEEQQPPVEPDEGAPERGTMGTNLTPLPPLRKRRGGGLGVGRSVAGHPSHP